MESGIRETLAIGDEEFEFELCRQPDAEFGSVAVDQWWMPVTQLYAQREQKGHRDNNHRSVLEFYWAVCRDQDATTVRDAEERYLLGTLLPDMRSEGSRRIFADAFGPKETQRQRDLELNELNRLIGAERQGTLTREMFHRQTWGLLGRPEFPDGAQGLYDEMCAALFDEACWQLRLGNVERAHESIRGQWETWQRQIGRRSGNEDEKVILDVLSYEARAAFHHCYSVVWAHLLPQLGDAHSLTFPSMVFLRFWHQDLIDPTSIDQKRAASLFHGHVFGLHPGPARLLLTENGQRLMGDWLSNVESVNAYQRVLHALCVAIGDYQTRRSESAESRRGRTRVHGAHDLVGVEEQLESRRRGHHRERPQLDD